MTLQELERLEAKAHGQRAVGPLGLGTLIPLMPGELLELCRLARLGHQQEAQGGKPA